MVALCKPSCVLNVVSVPGASEVKGLIIVSPLFLGVTSKHWEIASEDGNQPPIPTIPLAAAHSRTEFQNDNSSAPGSTPQSKTRVSVPVVLTWR